MAIITVAVEGQTDLPVIRRILSALGHDVAYSYGLRGKNHLDRNLQGYNNAARFAPWLVLRDLDHDATCPKELLETLLPQPAPQMMLRICVREMESWLLADHDALAGFLGVDAARIPSNPDALDDPKSVLVTLARRARFRAIRDDMVPAPNTSGATGPAYPSRVGEFVSRHWRPDVASRRSDSLRRCIARLSVWSPE